jgi:hypothetical protein
LGDVGTAAIDRSGGRNGDDFVAHGLGCCLDGLRVKEIRELSALGLKTSFFSLFGLYSKGLPRLQTLVWA